MCSPRVVNRAIYSIHAIEGTYVRGGGYRKRKGVVDWWSRLFSSGALQLLLIELFHSPVIQNWKLRFAGNRWRRKKKLIARAKIKPYVCTEIFLLLFFVWRREKSEPVGKKGIRHRQRFHPFEKEEILFFFFVVLLLMFSSILSISARFQFAQHRHKVNFWCGISSSSSEESW